jgi:hypothetical protein
MFALPFWQETLEGGKLNCVENGTAVFQVCMWMFGGWREGKQTGMVMKV